MKALIIEDEIIAFRRVKRLLHEINQNVQIIGHCKSVNEANKFLRSHHPDIIISDINLQDGTVFNLFDRLTINALWIFTSGYNEFAKQAFKNQAFDFLLKPIRINELKEAVIRARQHKNDKTGYTEKIKESDFSILVKFGSRYNLFKADNIKYFYRRDRLTIVVNKDKRTYPLSINLEVLMNRLEDKQFILLSQDVLIKLESIRHMLQLETNQVRLILHPPLDSDLIFKKFELMHFNKQLKQKISNKYYS